MKLSGMDGSMGLNCGMWLREQIAGQRTCQRIAAQHDETRRGKRICGQDAASTPVPSGSGVAQTATPDLT